ncbi:MAG: Hemoglobin and hemoglobin-haptoglobin-binding protein A precursor [Candidatus Heimdallarchaeota archaeon LC_3]|nr:MAG: Hemoglobin and hemoglobin-haptoglobin-binding protein A precursor [Candidatus Heimdallarchaeota archaeon LC_3]
MNRRTGILFGIIFISLISLIIGSMSVSIAEKQTSEQTPQQTSTQTSQPTTQQTSQPTTQQTSQPTTSEETTSIASEATAPVDSFGSGFSIMSILLLLLVLLVFPPLAVVFLFPVMDMPVGGGMASGFGALTLLPIIFIIGVYFILKGRREQK